MSLETSALRMKPEEDWVHAGLLHVYSDPQLREPKKYHALIQRLLDCGLVELTETRPTEFVECFFVAKKDGRLRMVVDCRRANQCFESSEHVALCTAESLRQRSWNLAPSFLSVQLT